MPLEQKYSEFVKALPDAPEDQLGQLFFAKLDESEKNWLLSNPQAMESMKEDLLGRAKARKASTPSRQFDNVEVTEAAPDWSALQKQAAAQSEGLPANAEALKAGKLANIPAPKGPAPVDRQGMVDQINRRLPASLQVDLAGDKKAQTEKLRKAAQKLKVSQGGDVARAAIYLLNADDKSLQEFRDQPLTGSVLSSLSRVASQEKGLRKDAGFAEAALPDLTATWGELAKSGKSKSNEEWLRLFIDGLSDVTGLPGRTLDMLAKSVPGGAGKIRATWMQRMAQRRIDSDPIRNTLQFALDPTLPLGAGIAKAGLFKGAEIARAGGAIGSKFGAFEKARKFAYGSGEEITSAMPLAHKLEQESAGKVVGEAKGLASRYAAGATAEDLNRAAREAERRVANEGQYAAGSVKGMNAPLPSQRIPNQVARDLIEMSPQIAKDAAYYTAEGGPEQGLAEIASAVVGLGIYRALRRSVQTAPHIGTGLGDESIQGLYQAIREGSNLEIANQYAKRGILKDFLRAPATGGEAENVHAFIKDHQRLLGNELRKILGREPDLDLTAAFKEMDDYLANQVRTSVSPEDYDVLVKTIANLKEKYAHVVKTPAEKVVDKGLAVEPKGVPYSAESVPASETVSGYRGTMAEAQAEKSALGAKGYGIAEVPGKQHLAKLSSILRESLNSPELSKISGRDAVEYRRVMNEFQESYRRLETLDPYFGRQLFSDVDKAMASDKVDRAIGEAFRTGKMRTASHLFDTQEYVRQLLTKYGGGRPPSDQMMAPFLMWNNQVKEQALAALKGRSRFAESLQMLLGKEGTSLSELPAAAFGRLMWGMKQAITRPFAGSDKKLAAALPRLAADLLLNKATTASEDTTTVKASDVGEAEAPKAEADTAWTPKLKDTSVNFAEVTPKMKVAVRKVSDLAPEFGEVLWTSFNDSTKHKPGSAHYAGNGGDIRTSDKTPEQIKALMDAIKAEFGSNAFVQFEKGEDGKGEHIHFELKGAP